MLFRLIEDVEKARCALFRRLQREDQRVGLPRQPVFPNRFASWAGDTGCDKNGNDVMDMLTGKEPLLNLKVLDVR